MLEAKGLQMGMGMGRIACDMAVSINVQLLNVAMCIYGLFLQ